MNSHVSPLECQFASNRDPRFASNRDPFGMTSFVGVTDRRACPGSPQEGPVTLSMVFDAARPGFWSRFPMVYDLFASPILTMAFLVSAAAMKVLASVGLNLRA
jgi:hypothetical protein